MKHVTCNFCGSDQTEMVNHGPDLLLNQPGDFHLVRCQKCHLIYQNPQLTRTELMAHYPDNYEPYERGVNEKLTQWQKLNRRHEMSRRCQRIQRYFPTPGRVLDVGCSTGLFLVAMRDLGWQVEGVELSEFAANYCRTEHQLTVHTGMLEDVPFSANSFEVVTLWDVLEHVLDPKATIQNVAHILKPNGLFVASLPNPEAYEARLFKDKWVGWDRPRHLHIFSQEVIQKYLEAAGFELVTIESFGGYLAMTLISLDFVMTARGVDPQKWQKWRSFLYNPLFRVATGPAYRAAGAFNKLSIMNVFARVKK